MGLIHMHGLWSWIQIGVLDQALEFLNWPLSLLWIIWSFSSASLLPISLTHFCHERVALYKIKEPQGSYNYSPSKWWNTYYLKDKDTKSIKVTLPHTDKFSKKEMTKDNYNSLTKVRYYSYLFGSHPKNKQIHKI